MVDPRVGMRVWVTNFVVYRPELGYCLRASVLATIVEITHPYFVRVENEELHLSGSAHIAGLREFSDWPVRPQTGAERMPGPHA